MLNNNSECIFKFENCILNAAGKPTKPVRFVFIVKLKLNQLFWFTISNLVHLLLRSKYVKVLLTTTTTFFIIWPL